jgi:hypothetical protein
MTVDLRRAPLTEVRGIHLRSPDRDLWADEAAVRDRLGATWAGLDDAAWRVPGAAPSDAGGPDWSLAEHIGHLIDWQELAIDYTARAIETGVWPSDEDYAGGDFDVFNEARREPWASMARDELLMRFADSRPALLRLAHRVPLDEIRAEPAWSWVYMTLHGHYLDHLGIIEAWTDTLRARQADGDPFVADPRPADQAGFAAAEAAAADDFDAIVRSVGPDHWDTDELTPGWTLRDHVGHLADWADEGARVVVGHRTGDDWPSDPDEGIDAWNEREVEAHRGETPAATLARYDAATARMQAAAGALPIDELRSPDGWSWTYDCLHGHVRKHLALIGPWSARLDWPEA